MTHRARTIVLAAFALAAGPATAVPYDLPGPEWQQLQSLDGTTLCQTGAPCDVPVGTYRLLSFGPTVTEERVTVGAVAPDGRPDRSELFVHTEGVTRARVLESACPTGRTISASCIAIGDAEQVLPVGTEAVAGLDGIRHVCRVTPERQGAEARPVTARSITMTSVCER